MHEGPTPPTHTHRLEETWGRAGFPAPPRPDVYELLKKHLLTDWLGFSYCGIVWVKRRGILAGS